MGNRDLDNELANGPPHASAQELRQRLQNAPGKVVIVSGPSGVGKDFVLSQWQMKNPLVQRVVSCTTRPPRKNETNNLDYHFLSVPQFQEMIQNGGFLEHKQYGEHLYGTPLEEPFALADQGKIAVLKIEVEGALEVMKKLPFLESVFILPTNILVLRRRLVERAEFNAGGVEPSQDDLDDIERRLKIAQSEIEQSDRYTHRIINHDGRVDETVSQLEELLGPKSTRTSG